ncbi:MAG: TIGR04086 family membrane protein [Epulopiscium sp.]|nr:TIGR04086 family membrane protein [Candidatus Epulonipiscium sp.]
MARNYRTKSAPAEQASNIVAILKGIIWSYVWTAVIFILAALLFTYTSFDMKHIPMIAMMTTLTSVFIAGFITARAAASKGWIWGMAAGGAYALILCLLKVMTKDPITLNRQMWTLWLMALGGGALGGMLGINSKR